MLLQVEERLLAVQKGISAARAQAAHGGADHAAPARQQSEGAPAVV